MVYPSYDISLQDEDMIRDTVHAKEDSMQALCPDAASYNSPALEPRSSNPAKEKDFDPLAKCKKMVLSLLRHVLPSAESKKKVVFRHRESESLLGKIELRGNRGSLPNPGLAGTEQ